jgi:serine/threonine protein kinase
VAVKVIDLKMLKNEINRTLLDSEIEILKELKNIPNILSLHDVFTTKNNTYIITELCESDLSKHIKKQLTEPEVFEYMNQLVKGYVEFQKREIVHRDLKPANLLITDRNMLKIADFGFGIKTDQLAKSSKYNVGSPLYMAPESLKKNEYSFKTDIWSIGVIFYEMLTNDTPWRAKN